MKIKIKQSYIPFGILVLFGVLLLIMSVANHYFFRTVTFDYGTYNFAFWDYSHFRISPSPIGQGTFLQDHYSFTFFYFIPVFWLFNWITDTYTLILIQYTMVMIAAWFSYKLILLKSNDIWLGAGTLVFYFVLFGRYTTMSCDCNLAVISACMIPVFLYFFELKKYIYAGIVFILALLSRENIPLWFIFIFFVLIIEHRKEKKVILISLLGILLSVFYFILLFKVLIPSIETADRPYTLFNYAALGPDPGSALSFIIRHPIETVKMFFANHLNNPEFDGIKPEFYLVYGLSGGFVLFFRPKYLIWFIPLVAQKMLNDNIIRWGISNYYSIEIVTLLPLSVFFVLTELKSKHLRYILAALVCIMTLSITLYKLNPSNLRIPWTANPSRERIYDKNFFKASFDVKKVNRLLKLIPSDAKVSSCDMILPHLAQRQQIYLFPIVNDADYIVISMQINNWMLSQETNDQKRNEYLTSPKWEVISKEYPVVLLKKLQNPNDVLKKMTYISNNTLRCDAESADANNKVLLFSNKTKADTLSKRSSEKARSRLYSIKLTKEDQYGLIYVTKDDTSFNYIEMSAWRNSDGSKGQLVASCGETFYQSTDKGVEQDSSGWVMLQLNFLVPENIKTEGLRLYLWNSGTEPVYFDDFSIKKY